MSTINQHPTFSYSQPEAYHFSHDSVFLAREVFERCASRISPTDHILDLCAGCGVVGMDFLFHCRAALGITPAACDFVEVQSEYTNHLRQNGMRLGAQGCVLRFLLKNYSTLLVPEFGQKYDLVMCNPPYFRVGQGKMSDSEFKNRCRFFMDSDFATLIKVIQHVLKPSGEAYVLLRELSDHGIDAYKEAQSITTANLEIVGDIRGTKLLRILPNP